MTTDVVSVQIISRGRRCRGPGPLSRPARGRRGPSGSKFRRTMPTLCTGAGGRWPTICRDASHRRDGVPISGLPVCTLDTVRMISGKIRKFLYKNKIASYFADASDDALEDAELDESLFVDSERVRIKAEAKIPDRRSVRHPTASKKKNNLAPREKKLNLTQLTSTSGRRRGREADAFRIWPQK